MFGADSFGREEFGFDRDEIDGVIRELESLRERLGSEGERVNREIANFADLTGAAVSAVRDISANIRIENSRSTD